MIKRNVLNKLSNRELEKYLNPDNRFVPEAVQVAFEILKERGHHFSESEKTAVNDLILAKKQEEQIRTNEEKEIWEDHLTEDPSAIKLHSRTAITILTVLFGTIPGSILLFLNLLTVRKYASAIFSLLIGFGFFFFQNYMLSKGFGGSNSSSRYNLEMGSIALGALILLVLSVTWMPKKLPYRPKTLILPIILSLVMIIMMYINYKGWFTAYPVVQVFKLIKDLLD
ncbi:hypothetical protein MKJ01_09045 [Chryseobacterium sp. SSA4.19]|uniref:hypothetical protein n=1 Tax=Chryseobacterium sp. SSA4.19 TaxID=2919915 RepID=UPI001F4DC7A6|nr:hypothetical protein [Chryseobacterium sp. SSA4.19]MCJ8153900.1 hypothetical protein [Chryseobacterium sp. SSA4.19]